MSATSSIEAFKTLIVVMENNGQLIDMKKPKTTLAVVNRIKSELLFTLFVTSRTPKMEPLDTLFGCGFSFTRITTSEDATPQTTATRSGMKNICCNVPFVLTIKYPAARVASRLPIAAARLIAAVVMPLFDECISSPIRAAHVGVAIEPHTACTALRAIN